MNSVCQLKNNLLARLDLELVERLGVERDWLVLVHEHLEASGSSDEELGFGVQSFSFGVYGLGLRF